jgi:type II secretory pathway pseudopilin PulG
MKPLQSQRGISTIEALASLTIFAAVAAGLSTTTISSIRQNDRSKLLAQASALVQDKIEELRALDPASNPAVLQGGTHADPLNPLSADPSKQGKFQRTWTVQRDVPVKGLAQVAVSVSSSGKTAITVTGVTFLCTTRTCT